MSDINPDSLKVADLRDQLKNRGLDTKGNKAALVARLKEAMDAAGEEYSGGGENAEDKEEEEEEEEEEEQMEETGEEAVYEEEEQADENAESANAEIEANGNTEEEPAVLGDEFRTIDEATQDDAEGNTDRKRKRSHSREHTYGGKYGRRSSPARKIEMDDTAWEALTIFNLDRYESDLNLRFNERGIKAYPLTVDGFAFMWSGVRATYGVKAGKVAYEAKILENLNVKHLPKDEAHPHLLRVGWSVNSSSLSLGEEALSFGFDGSGKASTDSNFVDYGQTFSQGDVITAYLDLDSDPVVISYAKNGDDLGKCFEIEKEKLGDQALFPHLMTKNIEFEVNFGGREGPYFPLKEGYTFLEQVPLEERVRGHLPPASKDSCEVIMMVGLPGAGKTYWVDRYVPTKPEKQYNVLGSNSVVNKMKVMGQPRKQHYSGRWRDLLDMAAKCLNRMVEVASHKKRNYIIDQTNVNASARRRKMQPFEGFHRRAVVVLPSDEVFKKRVKERTDDEGKDIPESAVNEMKANYTLPEKGGCYESVEYTEAEVTKEEREKLIEKYRREGLDALPPREKRYRRESRDFEYRGRGRGRSSFRGGFPRGRRSGFRSRSRGRGRISSRSRSRGYSSYRPPYSERREPPYQIKSNGCPMKESICLAPPLQTTRQPPLMTAHSAAMQSLGRGYRGGFREERRRDDRRDSYSYSYKPRGRGSSWNSGSDWGNNSWSARSYREPRWNSYEDDYEQGWDQYDQGADYDAGWDGYGDEGYDQGWDAYGYK